MGCRVGDKVGDKNETFNVEVCAATYVPCSHCQPVCDHKIISDKCHNDECNYYFNGWCRNKDIKCFMRIYSPSYQRMYNERINNKNVNIK